MAVYKNMLLRRSVLTNAIDEERTPAEEVNADRLERVLWVSPEAVWLIEADPDGGSMPTRVSRSAAERRRVGTARPFQVARSDVEAQIASGVYTVERKDPYARLRAARRAPRRAPAVPVRRRKERTQAELCRKRDRGTMRDRNFSRIEPLVRRAPTLFEPREWACLVRERVEELRAQGERVSESTIHRDLRRYLQGGQSRAALNARYDNCGYAADPDATPRRKRGRPSKLWSAEHPPAPKMANGMDAEAETSPCRYDGLDGVNLSPDMRDRIRNGIKRFRLRKRLSWRKVYQRTMETEFASGDYVLKNGVVVPILLPETERPTYAQLYYWGKRLLPDLERTLIELKGERAYLLHDRPLRGNPAAIPRGPGAVWQLDWTIGDAYLVSALDRGRIIGRPVICAVVDWSTGLITGFSVSLNGPDWGGARLALLNAATKKKDFCARYGVEIDEDDWPVHHLPAAVLGDAGLKSYNADHLAELGIEVQVAAPYRADWKALIERTFGILNAEFIQFIPGAVPPKREPGQRDYRLDACLTLDEFRQLMIRCILLHNNHRRRKHFRLDRDMIADGVEPYPLDLWTWGVENQVGCLREDDFDVYAVHLLPREQGSIGEDGLRFRGLTFSCDLIETEQWDLRARHSGRRLPVEVAYDTSTVDVIYLCLDDGRRLEPCQLHERDERFAGCDWQDVQDRQALEVLAARAARGAEEQAEAEFDAHLDHTIASAQREKRASALPLSRRAQISGVKDNRRRERQFDDPTGRRRGRGISTVTRAASQAPASTGPSPSPHLESVHDEPVPDSNATPERIELFRRFREERRARWGT